MAPYFDGEMPAEVQAANSPSPQRLSSLKKGGEGLFLHQSIPHPKTVPHNEPMSFSPASFVFPPSQAVKLHARVIGQSALLGRPEFVIKAVAARLRIGVRALEAFLRRLLILMAPEMEHDLVFVARPENLARVKPPKLRAKMPLLAIYAMLDRPYYFDFEHQLNTSRALKAMTNARTHAAAVPPVLVPIHRWLAQLDYLETIAKDPIAKAQRLAFSLARRRHGLLMAPPAHPRVMRGQGTECTAIYDSMASEIMGKSRLRPPPLPPPWRGPEPTITLL